MNEEHRVRCVVCGRVFEGKTDDEAYAKFNKHWKEAHAEENDE